MEPHAGARSALAGLAEAGDALDPAALIRAVALLHRIGPQGAAAALSGGGTGAVLAARLLWVPSEAGGSLEAPSLGRPDVGLVDDPAASPHWPLLLSRDVPFLPVGGWFIGGVPTSAERYVEVLARSGRLRQQPLQPSASPADSADQLVASPAWAQVVPAEQSPYARSLVFRQAVRASSAAIPEVDGAVVALATAGAEELDATWRQVVDGSDARRLRWDADTGRFTPPDGRGTG